MSFSTETGKLGLFLTVNGAVYDDVGNLCWIDNGLIDQPNNQSQPNDRFITID